MLIQGCASFLFPHFHILEYIYTHTGLCVFSSFLLQVSSMNESNDIPAEILEQHPEIETFDKVFADVGRT